MIHTYKIIKGTTLQILGLKCTVKNDCIIQSNVNFIEFAPLDDAVSSILKNNNVFSEESNIDDSENPIFDGSEKSIYDLKIERLKNINNV